MHLTKFQYGVKHFDVVVVPAVAAVAADADAAVDIIAFFRFF